MDQFESIESIGINLNQLNQFAGQFCDQFGNFALFYIILHRNLSFFEKTPTRIETRLKVGFRKMKLNNSVKIFWSLFALSVLLFGFQNCSVLEEGYVVPPSVKIN